MLGQKERDGSLLSYVSIEERIPYSHRLRRICKLAEQALETGGIKLSNKTHRSGTDPKALLAHKSNIPIAQLS